MVRMNSANIKERFWPQVEKTENCWLWRGPVDGPGYGRLYLSKPGNKNFKEGTHRISWELHNGPIPDGLWVLHHCDNPPCVRPDHLFLGTATDNIRDCVRKGRHRSNPPRGKQHPRWSAKLTVRDIAQIRELRLEGWSQDRLATMFSVTRSNISLILSGKTWPHLSPPEARKFCDKHQEQRLNLANRWVCHSCQSEAGLKGVKSQWEKKAS
jgi:hypothetical protein